MSAPRKHREAILESAIRLFRQQGYAGTGLAEILQDSGAPKGSLYHYFPGGKIEIGAAAVTQAGAKVAGTLRDLAAKEPDPGKVLERYLTLMAGWMKQSGYRDGSPITTTMLETVPEHPAIRDACAEAFASWEAVLTAAAEASGIVPVRAGKLARFSIAALEGALIQCRVAGSDTPLKETADELAALFRAARG